MAKDHYDLLNLRDVDRQRKVKRDVQAILHMKSTQRFEHIGISPMVLMRTPNIATRIMFPYP